MSKKIRLPITGLFLLALVMSQVTLTAEDKKGVKFNDVHKQTEEFIGYYHSIQLTAEQEKVKNDALSKIPAPCCSEFTQATCCCPCNLAKSVWGLSNYLIVKQHYDANQVRETALEWIHFINKDGFDGNSCKTGRCPVPFNESGCGGMNESHISY